MYDLIKIESFYFIQDASAFALRVTERENQRQTERRTAREIDREKDRHRER